MSAPEPVIHVSVSLDDGTSVRAAGDSKPWVQLGGLQDICVHPHSAAVAREVAQAFIEVAGLIEAAQRQAVPHLPDSVNAKRFTPSPFVLGSPGSENAEASDG